MLKTIVSLLLFLLIVVGQDCYTSVQSTSSDHKRTSLYQQSQDPCKKTMDYLFTNHFADVPQTAIISDYHDHFKAKCVQRLFAALNELGKQELQSTHIDFHNFDFLYADAVDYYVYALRRIII